MTNRQNKPSNGFKVRKLDLRRAKPKFFQGEVYLIGMLPTKRCRMLLARLDQLHYEMNRVLAETNRALAEKNGALACSEVAEAGAFCTVINAKAGRLRIHQWSVDNVRRYEESRGLDRLSALAQLAAEKEAEQTRASASSPNLRSPSSDARRTGAQN